MLNVGGIFRSTPNLVSGTRFEIASETGMSRLICVVMFPMMARPPG